jgi:hypothetical protein
MYESSDGDGYLALHAKLSMPADWAVPLVLARLGEIDLEGSRLTRVEVRRQHDLAARPFHLEIVRGPAVVLDLDLSLPGLHARIRRHDLEIAQADVDGLRGPRRALLRRGGCFRRGGRRRRVATAVIVPTAGCDSDHSATIVASNAALNTVTSFLGRQTDVTLGYL